MFPIGDENPSRSRPVVSWLLIALNILVFLWELEVSTGFLDQRALLQMFLSFGAVPSVVVEAIEILDLEGLSTLLTSMFLHGGITHIAGNMVYLFVFGDNVEDRFGKLGYLTSYLIFGLGAGIIHSYVTVMSEGLAQCTANSVGLVASCTPAVGASGAISGVLGAYLAMFPKAKVRTVVLSWYLLGQVIRIPAYYYLGFWFLLQLLYGSIGELAGGVAYWAHIGGFVMGLLFGLAYRLSVGIRYR